MIEDVISRIKAADMVLVGIGEELDVFNTLEKEERYLESAARIRDSGNLWMLPFLKKIMLENIDKTKIELYEGLVDCLTQKNYFIVSLCQDGLIRRSSLDKGRIVEPCGGYERLQCSKKCSTELYPIAEGLLDQIRRFLEDGKEGEKPKELFCPKCGSNLEFNNVDATNYVEEGYLEGWLCYKKWLQGTVNKNLCILELGVGMKYPTVVRWPFEKIVYFNKKAELFRIHDRLYQVAEEIRDRAHGICQRPDEFLRKLLIK